MTAGVEKEAQLKCEENTKADKVCTIASAQLGYRKHTTTNAVQK